MKHSLKQPRTTFASLKFLHECHTCVVNIGGETIPCSTPQDLWNLLAKHRAPLPPEESTAKTVTSIESTQLFLERGGVIVRATETLSRQPATIGGTGRGVRTGKKPKQTKAFKEAMALLADFDLTSEESTT